MVYLMQSGLSWKGNVLISRIRSLARGLRKLRVYLLESGLS